MMCPDLQNKDKCPICLQVSLCLLIELLIISTAFENHLLVQSTFEPALQQTFWSRWELNAVWKQRKHLFWGREQSLFPDFLDEGCLQKHFW